MKNETIQKCSSNSKCLSIIALCISCLTLGLLIGNWIGKCNINSKQMKTKKCIKYDYDGYSGSTCKWSEESEKSK